MRLVVAFPLVVLLGVGCGAAEPEAPSSDLGEAQQSLGSDPQPAWTTYVGFTGRYLVTEREDVLARTAGAPTATTGGPVPTKIYFPSGCEPVWPWLPRFGHQDDASWRGCEARVHHPHGTPDFTDAFPMVALLQGGNVPNTEYTAFAKEVASFGFIVVLPNLLQSFGPGAPPAPFTSQFVPVWVADYLTARDADPSSPLFRIVDTGNLAVVGHSFGAAAALAAVDGACHPPFCFPPAQYTRPASLKVAVAHGFQNCDPTQSQCFYPDTHAAATLIVNGGRDDPGAPTDNAYAALAKPRGLVVLRDTNHFGLTNHDLSAPGSPNPEPNGLPQELTVPRTARWTAAWLRAFFQGDSAATRLLTQPGPLPGVMVQSDL